MSARCCRDTPRCGDCPVRLKAMRLAAAAGSGTPPSAAGCASPTAALVAEVLAGGSARPLPGGVADALARLDAARVAGRRPAPAIAAPEPLLAGGI